MSKTSLKSAGSDRKHDDVPNWCKPQFIYGGPFIKVEKPDPFINTVTPMNMQLQGTFKLSYAHKSLKDRLPVILTKIIDSLSKSGKGSGDDSKQYIQFIAKLKSDLITNKEYDPFKEDTPDAKKWNEWIMNSDNKHYFTNTWMFTECYVYRKLREGCVIFKSLSSFDPFEEQKHQSFRNNVEAMCIVAEKMAEMLGESEKDKRRNDFCTLLKVCLWANKCDLSLSLGEQVKLGDSAPLADPFQMVLDLKDKLLVDDTGKAYDQVIVKAEAVAKAVEGNTSIKRCSCHRLATIAGVPLQEAAAPLSAAPSKSADKMPAAAEPAPAAEGGAGAGAEGAGGAGGAEEGPRKPPCPAKMVLPQTVYYDIVCDNAGYELFADLCFGHFLVAQNIVKKIRIHLKNMPWFVSDATIADLHFVINSCASASYNRTVEPEPKPAPAAGAAGAAGAEGEAAGEAEPPRVVSSEPLQALGNQWKQFLSEGVFELMAESYWTWPHAYKDMRAHDYNLYRKLQYSVGILFKGDLNYRKLLGERNCNPVLGFEPALQGFIPAQIIAARTVKSDLICGLPKGKFEALGKIDEQWMEKGEYGVIHFCGKAEALKASERPCVDYGEACFGVICPAHTDL